MKLTAVITPDEFFGGESGYVSQCPELGVASQGETIEEAQAMLQEAVEGFLEVASPAEIAQCLKEHAGLVSPIEVTVPDYAQAA